MSISQFLLGEFDHEMAGTRKTLERLPEGKFNFKPHEKSPTMGWMANHIVQMTHWGTMTCKSDSVDLAAPENQERSWTLCMGDRVFFTMPRVAVLRGMVFNHLIHHRAQLTVYLRMNGVPVPALYGPSADEGNF